MSDLDAKEQLHVRAALRHLHGRMGTWTAVAAALHTQPRTLEGAAQKRTITASLAIRVARLLNVMVDDLLVGRFLPPGACPNCGHVIASDFTDENTVVEEAPRQPAAGLSLVR